MSQYTGLTFRDMRVNVNLGNGVVLSGPLNEVRNKLVSLGFISGVYLSQSEGVLVIADMETKHIANAIQKILREEQSARMEELKDLFLEYRKRVQEYTELED